MAQKRTDQPAQRLSVVVPVYNEAPGILRFHQALSTVLGSLHKPCEIIYIDDGSIDDTAKVLAGIAADDTRVSVLELSRNFGHQAALIAGLDRAIGDVIITLDGDGEHPCELIVQMIELIDMGYEVVLTQRASDKLQLPLTKRFSSALFYAVINRLSDTPILPGSADFRAMTRAVSESLKQMGEYHKFLRGMIGLDPLRRTPMMRGAPSRKVSTWSHSTSADDSSASSSKPRRSD